MSNDDLEAEALGLCRHCHVKPREPGKVRCRECNAASHGRGSAARVEHKALGLCVFCSQPALPDHALCARHIEKSRSESKRRYAADPCKAKAYAKIRCRRLRAEGRCVRCGKPAYGQLCSACAERANARRRIARETDCV